MQYFKLAQAVAHLIINVARIIDMVGSIAYTTKTYRRHRRR